MRGKYRWIATMLFAIAALGFATRADAQIIYDDTVDPDLSNNYLAPTPLALDYGVNSIIVMSSVDSGSGMVDLDFLRIDLPVGGTLTDLNLVSWDESSTSGTSFIAFQSGSAFTFDPEGNPGDCIDLCLGGSHFGPDVTGAAVGDNLLVPMLTFLGEPSPRYDIPLTDPQYTFWIQENTGLSKFQLDFVVSIPGDYNGDLTVNAADYTVWRNTLGQAVAEPGAGADGNRDTMITMDDYLLWKETYGLTLPGGGGAGAVVAGESTVPEPSGGMLLLVGGLFAMVGAARQRGRQYGEAG